MKILQSDGAAATQLEIRFSASFPWADDNG